MKDSVDAHGVTRAGRRCKDCDGDVYEKDTKCIWCRSANIVEPYPPATTLEMAVAEVFEHDTKRSRVVERILKDEWPEEHGVQVLSGMVASTYHFGTGVWLSSEETMVAVRWGLARKRAS